MHDLIAITPLGGTEPRQDVIGTIRIAEVTDRALASVSGRLGRTDALQSRARDLFGVALPGPGAWVQGPAYALIWTGPDQWLADAPYASHEAIAAMIKAGLGDCASVTEQTDGWARFDVTGPAMFERLSAADTRRMRHGQAVRTVVEHLGCFLICRAQGAEFSVLGPRSSAGSLHHALVAAARSVG